MVLIDTLLYKIELKYLVIGCMEEGRKQDKFSALFDELTLADDGVMERKRRQGHITIFATTDVVSRDLQIFVYVSGLMGFRISHIYSYKSTALSLTKEDATFH